ITFVGPAPETLALFGDKVGARALAVEHGVPVLPGSSTAVTLDQARSFLASIGEGHGVVIKAVAGGGGRGMRVVWQADEVDEAFARCQSEAMAAFGHPAVYVEELLPRGRHLEIQVVGDGSGAVSHLGERECTVQRRHQKLIELAPSPWLSDTLRRRMSEAATRIAAAVNYRGLGTFEFL